MAENEYGVHTVTSHGSTLIKEHVLDYVTLSLLVGIELFLLYFVKPFSGFVGREMMMDLMYPMKDEIVPDWFVPTCSVLLPIAMFVIFYTRRKDVYDLHHSTLGLLFAVLINAIITDAMKNATGYPRPDFFWRCFPNGDATYNASTGIAMCHGNPNSIREGYKSFPSGRTSWSFAGLGFLSHYLAGKIKAFDGRGHIAKLCIVALPLSIASLVGLSQVDDYRHHWQDVSAGGLIVAALCYRQFFPAPSSKNGWAPHASHRAREASQEAPQEASQEAPQEASQEVPQEAPQEASQEAPQEAPQEASQEVPQEAPQEASQEAPQEASQEAPQEALQEASEEASQESAGDE